MYQLTNARYYIRENPLWSCQLFYSANTSNLVFNKIMVKSCLKNVQSPHENIIHGNTTDGE
jgi:hypothetical protein